MGSRLCHDAMKRDIDDTIDRMREGDDLRVQSFKDIGPNIVTALQRVKRIHSKGGYAVDAKGRRTDRTDDLLSMMLDDFPKMRKGLTPKQAAINGRRGRKPKERMPADQAAAFWFDKDILTNARALKFMTGWSAPMAHRQWPGGSGRPTNKGARPRRKRK